MTPLTKMADQIVSPATIPTMVREAFRVAQQERPGPVHLELPEDIARERPPTCRRSRPTPSSRRSRPSSALDRAARTHPERRTPADHAGRGGEPPAAFADALSEFVRRVHIPFFNTQMGKGAVTGGSDLYIGTAALSERDYVHRAIDRADLIIAIGHDTVEKPPFLMGPKAARWCCMSAICRPWSRKCTFRKPSSSATSGLPSRSWPTGLKASCRKRSALLPLREDILAHIADRAEESRYPLTPQRIVHDVRQVMPEDGIVCLDNGMYKIWFARNYRTHVANTLLLDNALATMGAGLPSAIMAALLHPHRRVLAVCGDGGFMMNSQELETAVRLGLNLVVLILADNAFGMIRWKQAVGWFS